MNDLEEKNGDIKKGVEEIGEISSNGTSNQIENKGIKEGAGEGQETSSNETPEQITIGEINSDRDSDDSANTRKTVENTSAGLGNLGLQGQKLSGAQRRKLRREQKMAAGTWQKEKPRNQQAWEQGRKRIGEDLKTAPQNIKKSKSAIQSTGQCRETCSGLRMAVIDRLYPEETFDQGQVDLIENSLVEEMDKSPTNSETPLQFTKTTFSGGVLWMTCANDHTKKWLCDTIAALDSPWEGADLTVVESNNLPKRPKVLVTVPGAEQPEDTVRSRLGKQNPGLRVGGWLLLSRKVRTESTVLAYSIDEASFKVLEENELRAFYKLGRVIFRVLKQDDGDRNHFYKRRPY